MGVACDLGYPCAKFRQHSSVDIIQEYDNICAWSARNKLTINTDDKTKKIAFHRPASLNIPPPFRDIQRVTQAKLLGIDISSTLSTCALCKHDATADKPAFIPHVTAHITSQGMAVQALHQLFTGLIMSKITYALPAFAGQLTVDNWNRINAISLKDLHRGVTQTASDIEEIIDSFDRELFSKITHPGHCLHTLLPPKTSAGCP